MLRFDGKVALVTGAAAGIGKAICERLAESGADLILVDIDEKKLNELSTNLNKNKIKITSKIIDLSKKTEIDRLWHEIQSSVPDIIINNAGIYPMKDFLEMDEPFFEKVYSINLKAVLWMCQHFIKNRINGGIIINVSSIEAVMPFKKEMVHYDGSDEDEKTGDMHDESHVIISC